MRGLLRAQRMTKWETFFSFYVTPIFTTLAPWGFASDSVTQHRAWGQSRPVPFIYILTDLSSILACYTWSLWLIGNLVFCYEGFLKRLFFAVNYIRHRVHIQQIKGPRKQNPVMTWVHQLECWVWGNQGLGSRGGLESVLCAMYKGTSCCSRLVYIAGTSWHCLSFGALIFLYFGPTCGCLFNGEMSIKNKHFPFITTIDSY